MLRKTFSVLLKISVLSVEPDEQFLNFFIYVARFHACKGNNDIIKKKSITQFLM